MLSVFVAVLFFQAAFCLDFVPSGTFFNPGLGSWTGRLVLPDASERRPNGAVKFVVYSTPLRFHMSFDRKQPIWIALDPNDEHVRDILKRTTTDINIAAKRVQNPPQKILPVRLNGWTSVSALETLAGARVRKIQIAGEEPTHDTIEVIIESAWRFDRAANTLYVSREPTQIVGRSVALIKFRERIRVTDSDATYRVQTFDPMTRLLRKHTFMVVKRAIHGDLDYFDGIEDSELNSDGWYAFGEWNFAAGVFEIRSIESRKLTSFSLNYYNDATESFEVRADKKTIIKHVRYEMFHDEGRKKGTFSHTSISTLPPKELLSEASQWSAISHEEQGLLIHVFGGKKRYDDPEEPSCKCLPWHLTTGHASLGTWKTIQDVFTKDIRFDITYFQVYAHNENEIISGKIKYHAFAGSSERGWAFVLPIADTLVKLPYLDFQFALRGTTSSISFLEVLKRELEVMHARFRSGNGKGESDVTLSTSCAQNSAEALSHAILNFYRRAKPSKSNAQNMVYWKKLESLTGAIKRKLIRLASFRTDWIDMEELPSSEASCSCIRYPFQNFVRFALSNRFVMPRSFYETLTLIFYEHKATEWIIHSRQIGGKLNLIYPVAPGLIPWRQAIVRQQI